MAFPKRFSLTRQQIPSIIALLVAIIIVTEGFSPINPQRRTTTFPYSHLHHETLSPSLANANTNSHHAKRPITNIFPKHSIHCQTKLTMSSNNNNNSSTSGIIIAIFTSGVLLFFVASAFAPLFDSIATSPSPTDLSLGNSVVTRQDGNKMKNYESRFDALSNSKIQEKLHNLPVFYLSTDGTMGEKIYLSYNEAVDEVARSSSSSSDASLTITVKVTTLDQIMYPLILNKGGPSSKPISTPPPEIKKAQQQALAAASSQQQQQPPTRTFTLVPSKASLKDAQETSTTLQPNTDIPLFVVERLAFAGNDGPQVPLFTEKGDAITSYARLREGGGNKLPEEPTIRTTSLVDVLESMERGSRPGVGQLQFYGNAEDVLRADKMSE